MSYSIQVSVSVSEAAYSSLDRIFSRATFTAHTPVNMPAEIFVVDASRGAGNYVLLYPAVPSDLAEIPADVPGDDGYLRVSEVSVDFDNPTELDAAVASIKARVQLLVETLESLDRPAASYDFEANSG